MVVSLVALPALGREQHHRYGDVEIWVLEATPESSKFGYSEARLRLRNHSSTAAHQVQLLFPEVPALQGELAQVSRTVELAPGANVEVSLLHPPLQTYGSATAVVIDGVRQAVLLRADTRYRYQTHSVLASRSIPAASLDPALNVRPGEDYTLEINPLPPSEWSSDWLVYAGFSGIVLTEDEVQSFPEDACSALGDYMAAGGSVLVFGAPSGSRLRQSLRLTPESLECSGMQCSGVGFGELLELPAADPAALSGSTLMRVQQSWRGTFEGLSTQYLGAVSAEISFPVLGEEISVPVRGMFLVLLAFAVLVGPVNLLWLGRRRRRMWMLWTVPLISAVTSLVIVVFALASEGMAVYERAEGVTLLDQDTHVAVSLGRSAYYAAVPPDEGLHFSLSTLVLAEQDYQRRARRMDWSRDQHLGSGWLLSRIPSHFLVRKVERRRERLDLSRRGHVLDVVNGLGAEIEQLWLMDGQGNVYMATGGIAPGAKMQLSRHKVLPAEAKQTPRALFRLRWTEVDGRLGASSDDWLQPGSYIAFLNDWPFLEDAMPTDEKNRTSVVLGRFDPASLAALPAEASTSAPDATEDTP